MKCPHCYCNYDDSERECPMCGTRSSTAACQNSRHKSITYPTTRTGAQPARARSHPAGNAAPRRPVTTARPQAQARPASYNRGSRRDPESAAKKRRRNVWIAIVAVILVTSLVDYGASFFYQLRRDLEYQDDGFHFYDDSVAAPEPVPEPMSPEPEDTPDDEIADGEQPGDGIVRGGDYFCEDTELYLTLDFTEETYWLSVKDHVEAGTFFTLANDPDVDSDYFSEEFPAAEYDSYVLYLQPDEEWLGENDTNYTLSVMYVPVGDTPDRFFLNNTFADAQWLPLDRAVLMERWG